ncbi:hypothetical protein [Streptomyces rubiginosohelvolus]|uniref:hypothetical protein n=1 Tax=Streptomyces rubiginosohelvolus TaxID=67362 RepID=UPI0035DB2189
MSADPAVVRLLTPDGGGEPGDGRPSARPRGAGHTHFYQGTHSPPQWERELRSALSALPRNLGRWGRR